MNVISCCTYIPYKILSDSIQQNPGYEYQKKILEEQNFSAPNQVMYTQIVPMLFLIECILCKNFCAIPFCTSQDMTIKRVLEKTELQCLLARYVHTNCNIFFFNNTYLVCKILCNFIQQKPKSVHFKKSGKRLIAALFVKRFLSKVDRH